MSKRLTLAAMILSLGTFAIAAPPQSNNQQQNRSSVQITQQPQVEGNTGNSATIAWSTNVQAGSKVKYGTDPNNLTQTATAPWGGVTHRVYLKNLQPNTTYYYQAVSEHASGTGTSAMSSVGQFSTNPNGQQASNNGQYGDHDNDADDRNRNNRSGQYGQNGQYGQDRPNDNVRILAGPIVQDVRGNTATLWWQTDDRAATRVRYGTDPNNMNQTSFEPGGSRDHRAELTNLQPGQTYYYEILKRYGSLRTTGRFTMPNQNAGTTPTYGNTPVQNNGGYINRGNRGGYYGGNLVTAGPTIQMLGPTNAVIAWSTQAPASSIVRYGTDPNSLTQTAQAPWGSTTHRVALNNLQPSTQYYFEVISTQQRGPAAASAPAVNTGQFQTLNPGQQALTISQQ